MTVEMIDGIRVLKLHDATPARAGVESDTMTMVHIWRLLSGGHAMRDASATERRYL